MADTQIEAREPASSATTTGLLGALRFAADKHRKQRRKGAEASPYINHPIAVAETLARCNVTDLTILQAALLHDTIEDTETTPEELEREFGPIVRRLVEEVTDDKKLPQQTRKDLQVQDAPLLSAGAKQIRIADKVCNVHDVTHSPPPYWELPRRIEYLNWAEQVVAECRGCNAELERIFDEVAQQARTHFAGQAAGACVLIAN